MNRSRKRIIATLMSAAMVSTLLVGCGGNNANETSGTTNNTASDSTSSDSSNSTETKEIKEFTMFSAVPGTEINDDNEVQQKIADIVGAKCKETWLTGQTAEEAIGVLIAGGEYPDFICGSDGHAQLMEAEAYIPLDEYWDDYPNIKNYLSEEEWNKVRAEDGHVYIMPQFGIINGTDMECIHNDEAFWIQTRVLKWAGYPTITTLDEYFQLIEDYLAANPTMEDGTTNIGYEILCDDWRYFCLENAPQFLDGYPNDGCALVNPTTLEVYDYNTTDTAVRYFKKLNEEYKKGIIDPETFTASYDQYIAKVSSGRVLGMIDQYWDFSTAVDSIKSQDLEGCTYVPLGIVIDEGIEEHYHSASALDATGGLGITVSCKDIPGALSFLNDLLSEEVQTLRYWGVEGEDYLVNEDGTFYRTQEMRDSAVDQDYKVSHLCPYSYFPHYEGQSLDGINAWSPDDQPNEFYDGLDDDVKECLSAYDAQTYVQMLNPSGENSSWYPLWSYTNTFTTETESGLCKTNMDEVKHAYLPKVVMADDFDSAWQDYMTEYQSRCNIEAYLSDLSDEVQRRVAIAEGTSAN